MLLMKQPFRQCIARSVKAYLARHAAAAAEYLARRQNIAAAVAVGDLRLATTRRSLEPQTALALYRMGKQGSRSAQS